MSMSTETKQTRTPDRNNWIPPEEAPNTEVWKGAPSRESTGADPESENARLTREGRAEQNAPVPGTESPRVSDTATSLRLIAPSFEDGTSMPDVHAATGGNLSPPLRWTGVPTKARSLALLMEDPDVEDPKRPKGPNAAKRIFTHWIIVNLPPSTGALAAGASHGKLPGEAQEGRNDNHTPGYTGPAPPIGRHRYFFRLYALDTVLPEQARGIDRTALLEAIRGHVLGETRTVGTYEKPRNPTS
jgi:Raf kinase inhibitor-like YbhB/YbcL family protein